MNLKSQVIIFNVSHYNMEDNKGLSVLVVGDLVDNNNKFGRSVSSADIPNYGELMFLKQIPAASFPARFDANIAFGTKKVNGKEIAALNLSNLKYLNSVEITDIVEPKK